MGEAGHWPAATKTAAEWFPAQERALGMGVINSGAALGSAIAAPLIAWLDLRYGWQTTFVVTGSFGFVWIVLWIVLYRLPERHCWIGWTERNYILAGQSESERAALSPPWPEIIRHPGVWGIAGARFLADSVWWFYLIWLPLYLHTVRGFSMEDIGLFVWIPYVAADAGSLLGGWTSGHLIQRGWSVYNARAAAIIIATCLAPAGLLVVRMKSPALALSCISVVLFSFQFWVNNVQTLPSDLFPTRYVGSIAGMAGTAAGIGAILFTLSTGWVTERYSYKPMLLAASLLIPLATLVLYVLVRPRHFREAAQTKAAQAFG